MYEISRILYKLGIPSTKQTKLNNVDIETYLGETEETNKFLSFVMDEELNKVLYYGTLPQSYNYYNNYVIINHINIVITTVICM